MLLASHLLSFLPATSFRCSPTGSYGKDPVCVPRRQHSPAAQAPESEDSCTFRLCQLEAVRPWASGLSALSISPSKGGGRYDGHLPGLLGSSQEVVATGAPGGAGRNVSPGTERGKGCVLPAGGREERSTAAQVTHWTSCTQQPQEPQKGPGPCSQLHVLSAHFLSGRPFSFT